jgi:hypothetical protein
MSFRDWQPQYVADEIAACESSPRHGGEASRGKRYSKYITRHQAKNLLEALSFADKRGLRLNVAIDICWPMFPGVVDERTRFARCQQDCVVKRDDQHCAHTTSGKLTGDFRSRIEAAPAMPAKGSAS